MCVYLQQKSYKICQVMGEFNRYKTKMVDTAILLGANSEGFLHLPTEGREEYVRILVLYFGI